MEIDKIRYKAAIIGCGRIGCGFDEDPKRKNISTHAGAYSNNLEIELVALADVDQEALEKYSKRFNVPRKYTDYKEMLANEKLDIISVCTWNKTHFEIVQEAVKRGVKAIFCEKPISDNVNSAKEMIKICNENNVLLMINHQRRFDPTHQEIKKFIAEGKLGIIQQASFYYTAGIANTGSHMFDLLRFFLGDAQWIQAIESNNPSQNNDDPNLDGIIKFSSGTLCTVQALDVKDYLSFDFTVFGSKGKIHLTNSGFKVRYYEVGDSEFFSGYKELQETNSPILEKERNFMVDAVKHLVFCLDSNQKPICSGEEGLASLELITAFKESAKQNGQRIMIEKMENNIITNVENEVEKQEARVNKLALFGGKQIRTKLFPAHPMIDEKEINTAVEVLKSGKLSTFVAAPGKGFLGGEKIKEFENIVAEYHQVKYAVAFNSATAALHAAVVACGIQPGEEIITTPYTFTSTATCALMANVIPVFADINEEDYNINPEEIKKKISSLTKAIIPVHLFGGPAKMDEVMQIAREHNLKVIEDCAQAPDASYKGKKVGTIGDCGILSFTENKHITSGEGGMLITNDENIAEIARLVRNHGEAVLAGQPRSYKSSILGWNYRMTEVDAAIGIEQFKKLDYFNVERIKLANYLTEQLKLIPGLTVKPIAKNNKHVYYVLPIEYDESVIGIPRDLFVKALNAEGIPFGAGYVKPLYYSPIYHENKPFIYKHYQGNANYDLGSCPIAENMHFKKLIITILCRPPATVNDMDDIINAFKKVISNKDEFLQNKV